MCARTITSYSVYFRLVTFELTENASTDSTGCVLLQRFFASHSCFRSEHSMFPDLCSDYLGDLKFLATTHLVVLI